MNCGSIGPMQGRAPYQSAPRFNRHVIEGKVSRIFHPCEKGLLSFFVAFSFGEDLAVSAQLLYLEEQKKRLKVERLQGSFYPALMKLFLTDQSDKFQNHLEHVKAAAVMNYDKGELIEKLNSIPLSSNEELQHLNLDFFFDYKIFPKNIMSSLTQWQQGGRGMRVGDTILQQVFLPPTKVFSQKVLFGVRICEIIESADKRGFSYETLQGHVEKGISTFTIEKRSDKLEFVIHTFSKPGNVLTSLLGPVVSIPYQTFCTKAALSNVKRQIEQERS